MKPDAMTWEQYASALETDCHQFERKSMRADALAEAAIKRMVLKFAKTVHFQCRICGRSWREGEKEIHWPNCALAAYQEAK